MRILAIDIGAGTQDILLFDSKKKIENSVSLVLPTPSKVLAEKLRKIEGSVYIRGDTIGGGSLTRAVTEHLKKGYRVVMESEAAYSIRNDLDEVLSMGIEVGEKPKGDEFEELCLREVEIGVLRDFLSRFGVDLEVDVIALAVQDHGVAPKGTSDRIFRFDQMEALLRRDNRPETFHYVDDEIPNHFIRMRSALRAVRREASVPVLLMDTSLSAILGCADEAVGPCLIVNVGNGHTIGALLVNGRVEGLYEHHTHALTPEKLERHLRLFLRGELSREEVFDDQGHGALTLRPFFGDVSIVVTGPNRDLFQGTSLRFVYGAPAGNTMMSGPMGLIKAALFRYGKKGI